MNGSKILISSKENMQDNSLWRPKKQLMAKMAAIRERRDRARKEVQMNPLEGQPLWINEMMSSLWLKRQQPIWCRMRSQAHLRNKEMAKTRKLPAEPQMLQIFSSLKPILAIRHQTMAANLATSGAKWTAQGWSASRSTERNKGLNWPRRNLCAESKRRRLIHCKWRITNQQICQYLPWWHVRFRFMNSSSLESNTNSLTFSRWGWTILWNACPLPPTRSPTIYLFALVPKIPRTVRKVKLWSLSSI